VESAALVAVAAAVAAAAVVCAALVRIVPAGHCGVVTRAGRVARTRPSGLLVAMPVVERVAMVDLHPRAIDPLGVTVSSRDGVEIRLVVSVLWRVCDAAQAAQSESDGGSVVASAVERALHHLVAEVDLRHLISARQSLLAELPLTTRPLLEPLGVALVDVDLLDADVRVGLELFRLLAHDPKMGSGPHSATPPAPQG
jgi:regulator of protease activity HflC (stomatin/prohibitin superfamily)